jgi:2-polyprenyl-3-methyl-5-hydroxy-6-metoxy-1,4-benzoquinol methylase
MDAALASAYAELYRTHWWFRVREAILLRKIEALLRDGPRPARILDIGCGAGVFFDALSRFGHVEGIESDVAIVGQSGRWRDRITLGELDDSFKPATPFDLILLLDVLEHVSGPDQLLRRAHRLLARNGRIIMTVPAFQALWTTHDDINHHLRRYSTGLMRRTILDAGLIVDEMTYFFQSLVLPKLIVRLLEAMKGAAPRVPRTPSRFLNSSLEAWFSSEFAIAGRLPFGTSLMAVARRPDGATVAQE